MKIQVRIAWGAMNNLADVIYLAEKLCCLGFKPSKMPNLDLRVEFDKSGGIKGYEIETDSGTIPVKFAFSGWVDDKARESLAKEMPQEDPFLSFFRQSTPINHVAANSEDFHKERHDQNLIDEERGK